MDQILSVIIRKQDGIVFQGDVKSVTSTNEVGPFDILPMHANFIAIIKEKIELIDANKKHTLIAIARGLIHVKENLVKIYIGI